MILFELPGLGLLSGTLTSQEADMHASHPWTRAVRPLPHARPSENDSASSLDARAQSVLLVLMLAVSAFVLLVLGAVVLLSYWVDLWFAFVATGLLLAVTAFVVHQRSSRKAVSGEATRSEMGQMLAKVRSPLNQLFSQAADHRVWQ